ncbi:asparaginase [Dongia mobilis]|uniref:asparaginase n=1 Tax=Dongia sp. TaxID=1977262 RepID=UPI0026F1E753
MNKPHQHLHVHADLPRGDAPILVEVWRGNMVESRHRAIAAVVDADGHVVKAWGDVETPIYGRSSIKPLLAIPLVESGAADRYGLTEREIALACASHSGEPGHVEAVNTWLAKIGLSADDLECGAHFPYYEPALHDMVRGGITPTRSHNNCSGKHTGFLSTAVHLGEKTAGYIGYEHSVQQRLLGTLEQMCGQDLSHVPRGIDGCGIPTIAIPVGHHALAMAKMADPKDLAPARAAACARILTAMSREPWYVAGTGRFCTDVMKVTGTKAAIKTGAEGVYMGSLPELGLGICIKAEDGNGRGAEIVMGQLLRHFGIIDAAQAEQLQQALQPTLRNWAGTVVGSIKPAPILNETAPF